MIGGLRLTVSIAYRTGSEVLLADSGPLSDLAAVRAVLHTIDDAFDRHGDLILGRGGDLIVRPGERRFERERVPAAARPKRALGTRF